MAIELIIPAMLPNNDVNSVRGDNLLDLVVYKQLSDTLSHTCNFKLDVNGKLHIDYSDMRYCDPAMAFVATLTW